MIVLETNRLLFRDHAPEDLEPYCAMESDPEVRKFVGGKPRTREAAEQKFRTVSMPSESDRLGMWATVLKPEGSYIGRCGVYTHIGPGGPVAGEGVLAFYLARAYWGRGLATEAGRAFVEFGFGELGLLRVVATAQVGNDASVRVLHKLGFTWVQRDEGEARSYDKFELRNPATRPSIVTR
jgi:[ribosomal protein S5]-alanine N-acetyltransferase